MNTEKPLDLKPCPYCGRPGSLIDGLAECTDPDCENTIMMSPEGWNRRPVESVPAPAGPITGETSDGYHTFNELYEHRHALFAVACHFLGGWKSKLHEDGTMFPGWFIAGLTTSEGMATYHLPERLWERFPGRELERAPAWDGHTANDVIERLWAHVAALPRLRASLSPRPATGARPMKLYADRDGSQVHIIDRDKATLLLVERAKSVQAAEEIAYRINAFERGEAKAEPSTPSQGAPVSEIWVRFNELGEPDGLSDKCRHEKWFLFRRVEAPATGADQGGAT